MNDKVRLYGILTVLVTVLFLSCTSRPCDSFTIQGEIKGFGDGVFYVSRETVDGYANDTVTVRNDTFSYRSSSEYPICLMFLAGDNAACDRHATYSFLVFAGNSPSPIHVEADVAQKIENARISGSAEHAHFEALMKTGVVEQLEKARYEKEKASGDSILYRQKSTAFGQYARTGLKTLFEQQAHCRGTAMAYMLYRYFPFLSVDGLEKEMAHFPEDIVPSVYWTKLKERIRRERGTVPGMPAPEFHLKDTAGHVYSLKDFKGRMVLLDFTASWCYWCKKEVPYLEAVHRAMQGKDFEIVSVYLDKQEEDWEKEVRKGEIPWKCLTDGKAWKQGGMAYDYYVGGIPCLILIGKDGRIAARGTRGEETLQRILDLYR